jgi:hypothetical protein
MTPQHEAQFAIECAVRRAEAEIPCGPDCVGGYCNCSDTVRMERGAAYARELKKIIRAQADIISDLRLSHVARSVDEALSRMPN